jgi:hypothetical protein
MDKDQALKHLQVCVEALTGVMDPAWDFILVLATQDGPHAKVVHVSSLDNPTVNTVLTEYILNHEEVEVMRDNGTLH